MKRFFPQRCLALLLILALLCAMLPVPAGAEGSDAAVSPSEPLPEETTEPSILENLPPESTVPSLPEETLGTAPPEETAAPTLPEESTEPSLPEESTEATVPQAPPETQPPEKPTEPPADTTPQWFFGRLHGHSTLSGGDADADILFSQAAAGGLDFYAVTDHSDTFDSTGSKWAAGIFAAEAAADGFLGLYGWEMSWPRTLQLGHIGVFSAPDYVSWEQSAYQDPATGLNAFYRYLDTLPGAIGMFCHPGTQYGTFANFDPSANAGKDAMALLEVSGGDLSHYVRALDQGWYVAPAGSGDMLTAIFAQTLTETAIFDAMRSRRICATDDTDLQITYTLNGSPMGSRLERRHIRRNAELYFELLDPTDSAVGTVTVVTEGGSEVFSCPISTSQQALSLSLSPEVSYYFLKITQPDGDVAVTAPIWIDQDEDLGIRALRCETAVPVQGQPLSLELSLYNEESADFLVDSLEILADGEVIYTDPSLPRLAAGASILHPITLSCGSIGSTQLSLWLSGTLEGAPRSYEAGLELCLRRSDQVTAIALDGSHGNTGLDSLTILEAMASRENIRLRILRDTPVADTLETCHLLVVTPPTVPFSDSFLAALQEFADYGGSILVCGPGEMQQLNRLLEAIGSSLRLEQHSVNSLPLLSGNINRQDPWCAGIPEDQRFSWDQSCTVDPGDGVWLVKSKNTPAADTLLAREVLPGGGTVFAAGSLFLSDDTLEEPENIWDPPCANRALAQSLLEIGGEILPLSTILQARTADPETLVRIRGYVTAGTSNPYTTFPETLYLQDTTGGIAVTPFQTTGIPIGTPIEITGYARESHGCRSLKYSSHEVLIADAFRYLPLEGDWKEILDPALHGGELVQVEGRCTQLETDEDGTLVGITLTDSKSNTARICVTDGIFSHATGKNTLHETIRKGRTVRAVGLLEADAEGNGRILVRNCEEVVYVPPRNYYNPKTADPIFHPVLGMSAALSGLILLVQKRKNTPRP